MSALVALLMAAAATPAQGGAVLQHVTAFAEAASRGEPLPFAAHEISYGTVFDTRTMTRDAPLAPQEFAKVVAGCAVSAIATSADGATVSLSCPSDPDHGYGVVSYSATMDGGRISHIGLRVGPVVAVARSQGRH